MAVYNKINIIYWISAIAVLGCICYLDKKIPERKLRNSNKWIQGIWTVVLFLWVIFPEALEYLCIIAYITMDITDGREQIFVNFRYFRS